MTYAEKLLDPFWKTKRHWIIRRDNFKCVKCAKTKVDFSLKVTSVIRDGKVIDISEAFHLIPEHRLDLNVHHKYYREGLDPWEYNDEALITLCPECHKNEHETSIIPIYFASGEEGVVTICDRCQGSGYLPQFNHVMDGVCFKCWGEGVDIDKMNDE